MLPRQLELLLSVMADKFRTPSRQHGTSVSVIVPPGTGFAARYTHHTAQQNHTVASRVATEKSNSAQAF